MIDLVKRIIRGCKLLMQSGAFFIHQPSLILLTILEAFILFSFITLTISLSSYYYSSAIIPLSLIAIWLTLYFAVRIIDLFFAVANAHAFLTATVHTDTSVIKSLKVAFSKLVTIIKWATVWSFFSLYRVSKPTEYCQTDLKKSRSEFSKAILQLLDFSWNTNSLLIPPIIAMESNSITSLTEKEHVYLKDTFGEKIEVRFNFGIITLFSILLIITAYLYTIYAYHLSSSFQKILLFCWIAISIYLFSLISCLKTIYKSLIYAHIVHKDINHRFFVEQGLVPIPEK